MNTAQARKICRDYYSLTNPSEEDEFQYTEALRCLIEQEKSPGAMAELGGYYYEHRRFDLAQKYYEIAAEYGHAGAALSLGYIYYYGRTGAPNYEKAFYYYQSAADRGSLTGAYKVADMVRNGYYVEKDPARYREIIESLYPKVCRTRDVFDPLPEIFTRLAAIRAEEGRTDEALDLYDRARNVLAKRIRFSRFFGDLSIMKRMIADIYRLRPFDPEDVTLYDLYEVLRTPARVRFWMEDEAHTAESVSEDGQIVVCFDGKWFRSVDEFFAKAQIGDELLTTLYEELYDFEVNA